MDKKIGTILKKLRKNSGMSVSEVLVKLKELGQEIQQPTLYAYENNTRAANADMFIALCQIYGCNNVLETFAGIEVDYSIPDDSEWKMIEKYRFISENSPDGAKTVDYILNREYNIANQLKENQSEYTAEQPNVRNIQYYQRLASAGTGQIVFDGIPTESIEIPNIPKYSRVSYAIGVNGDSMEPLYSNGDMLLIEPTCQIEIGEIGIFIVDNHAYVKKLGDGKLISLNKGYDDIPFTEYSQCMGRVVDKLEL
ncbi:XRE family transcriptional regulator [Anaerovorax odorimutans]|uniref:XRE family transcriptional regulator n=1 Tax=Anaerovorax odorimutans TaxID=109327 RepID=A0ABT1RS83_9FIRM|nr:XRE family transcriptional regulator [Anaerovorax odorimutans]MCQ4638004.1 XRE family transcriptional regulator [Anaerovorax odorimutans]